MRSLIVSVYIIQSQYIKCCATTMFPMNVFFSLLLDWLLIASNNSTYELCALLLFQLQYYYFIICTSSTVVLQGYSLTIK